ncbi:MAG: hypothetical protein AB2L24_30200 [Mangrovibacterium sp.]
MRNNILSLIILGIAFLRSLNCHAQVIDNHFSISAEYVTGVFYGKEDIKEKDFIYPSLYNNFTNLSGISLNASYKIHPHISLGINMDLLDASDWEYDDHSDYTGSEIKLKSMAPLIRIHNKFSNINFSNRGKIFIEAGPVIGLSRITLANPLFDIRDGNYPTSSPMRSEDPLYGIKGGAGLEWGITQSVGIIATYSIQRNWVSSKLYSDSSFTSSQLSLGLVMKLMKYKRFFY